jgi:hypothetical protein
MTNVLHPAIVADDQTKAKARVQTWCAVKPADPEIGLGADVGIEIDLAFVGQLQCDQPDEPLGNGSLPNAAP